MQKYEWESSCRQQAQRVQTLGTSHISVAGCGSTPEELCRWYRGLALHSFGNVCQAWGRCVQRERKCAASQGGVPGAWRHHISEVDALDPTWWHVSGMDLTWWHGSGMVACVNRVLMIDLMEVWRDY
mmetsp:Transcript_26756/g.58334  ORF Transcript_26756/g.58334 Transcript_26756/m.58334 type:complete len:127 (+) Transcript_26756:51-431(+)